jgi:alkaline phosphatase D
MKRSRPDGATDMVDSGRRHLLELAAGAALTPLASLPFIRHARAADVDRFTLGVASGCPRPDSVVLWTRLLGADLPERLPVAWELARDEGFREIAASGVALAEGATAHSVHVDVTGLAPGRWYWYRFGALGGRSSVGRTRTAPAVGAVEALQFAIASCQRWDHGHYAAWRHMADERLDLVLFLGDYIYESAPAPASVKRVRSHGGTGAATTLQQYRDRYAQYKADPALQRMHAAAPWIMVWDDHEVENDYANDQGQALDADFPARRAAAYQAYWEHLPFPAALRPRSPDMRIFERYDWGRLARIHAIDDRQYRDPQACPRSGRGGASTVTPKDCPALLDPRRTLLGAQQERWLADGWSARHGWNLLAQQTLMARFSWREPALREVPDVPGGLYWTDGWDGYPAARARLLESAVARKAGNVVVLGGDVHANYVADLKLDYDDAESPVVATEFCGTSITSEGMAQSRIAAALPFNPHIRYGRAGEHGYTRFTLGAKTLQAQLRVVDDVLDPASAIRTAAGFVVEAGTPGARPA